MSKKITYHDIKQALLDERFRNTLPPELATDVQKFLKNPGCACNHPIYIKIAQKAQKELIQYFPTKEVETVEEMQKKVEKLARNDWQVINCHIDQLGEKLRGLKPGRKQLDIARWQDQVTVVINHLEEIF